MSTPQPARISIQHPKAAQGFQCQGCRVTYRWRTDSKRYYADKGQRDTLNVVCKCGIEHWKEAPIEE